MLRSGVCGGGGWDESGGGCDVVGSCEREAEASKSRAECWHQIDALRNCRRAVRRLTSGWLALDMPSTYLGQGPVDLCQMETAGCLRGDLS